MSRQWRDLHSRKRFGFGHEPDKSPGNGELALFCATCPQPGINLPDDWKTDPDWSVSFVYQSLDCEMTLIPEGESMHVSLQWMVTSPQIM